MDLQQNAILMRIDAHDFLESFEPTMTVFLRTIECR